MGAVVNSGVNKDYTSVSLRVLKKDVGRAFPIYLDALTRPNFPVTEVKKEIARTIGAIRSSEDQPGVVAEKAFENAVYDGGPYGRPTEGTKESVSKLNRGMVSGFHQTYFHPNNAILIVVGDVDDGLIKKYMMPMLENWPKKNIPAGRTQATFSAKGRTLKIDKPVTQSNIVIGNGGMSRDNPDYY